MRQDLNQLLHLLDIAHNFETNMKVNLAVTLLPGAITLFGAFFLGFGIIHSVILNAAGVTVGASNAVLPWLREQKKLNGK